RILEMYDETIGILEDVARAFETEDTRLARSVFVRDEAIDAINNAANAVIAEFLRRHPEQIEEGLYLVSMIRKHERVGDHCKNMAEEIIFYIEAKVLKHKSKKKKAE